MAVVAVSLAVILPPKRLILSAPWADGTIPGSIHIHSTRSDGRGTLDEISTTGGHYIALDMPKAPYALGGEPRDVVDDVKRLGGFGIVAHPDSPKSDLQWRDWTAPFDAIEIINPDTSWRQQMTVPEPADRMSWPKILAVPEFEGMNPSSV